MRRRRKSVAIAALLVASLVGAPLARAVPTPGCRTCPPQCPMHRKAKLGCHEMQGQHHGCGARGPGIAPPGCGGGPALPAIALPPAVLPAPVVVDVAVDPEPYRPCAAPPCVRGADPPDTPPPIVAS